MSGGMARFLLPGAVALLLSGSALAADPQPYTVTLPPTNEAALDLALKDSSNLMTLRENAPVGPFALVSRARDDQARLGDALSSFGHYAATIRIQIAGRALDDPALPAALDAATGPVAVTIAIAPGPVFKLRRVTLPADTPPEGRAALKLEPGQPAIAAEVLAAQGRVLDALRKSGHALAKVGTPAATLDPAAQALDVSYTVDAGPRVALGPIAVDGLDRVSPGLRAAPAAGPSRRAVRSR